MGFDKLTLRAQIMALVAILLALFVVVGGVTYFNLKTVDEKTTQVDTLLVPRLLILDDTVDRSSRSNTNILRHAAEQDKEKMIEEKKFRQDLYHRLSTFIIHLPPLRERSEDIPILVRHFVDSFAQKMKKNITGVNEKVLDKLVKYHFPGNIRELRNIIERAVILCDDNELQISHFDRISAKIDEEQLQNDSCYDLELVEKNAIEKVLDLTDFSKAKASTMLNISWQTLDRKMKKYNIPEKRKESAK